MAIPHPPDHLLRPTSCMLQAPVRIPAAAAIFTRSLEFNPIQEEATLPQIRNPRIGTTVNTASTVFGQKVPANVLWALVSDTRDFVLSLLLTFL